MTLNDLFDLSFRGRRDTVALEWNDAIYTFGELDARGNRAARILAARGFVPGDRLCVYLPNSLTLIDLYLACIKLGVIFVPINILYRDREIQHILADAAPRLIASASALPGGVSAWTPEEIEAEMFEFPPERPPVRFDGDAPAAIVYTSGTTGASKGAILTHNNFAANALNLIACWRISDADRLLLPLPLFHVHGLGNGLHCWLISGCRTRLLERFEHQRAAEEFLDFRATLFFGVPTMYIRLLDLTAETAREIGGLMRLFICGSAPLPPRVLEDFRMRFGHSILERYGMTETCMTLSNPYEGERRAGAVGLPLPGISAKIVDGELWVKGPNVFPGYWRRDDATREAFSDGWFRTGDLADCSDDGYFTLRGRKNDIIISGGYSIYPREIEEFLLEMPGVAEVAVTGIPDPIRGEVPIAYIVPHGSLDTAVIEAHCRAHMASFKVPRAFLCVDSLPRTALGKVQKHLLPKPEVAPR